MLFLSFGLLAALLGYVRWEAPPRADLRYANSSGIHTLDPARMSWNQDLRIAMNIWEGLTTYDPETATPTNGAAYFPPRISDDGLTYTFTIREDARWSNGDPVTAVDFLRGWRRCMEPGTATDYTFLFSDHISGVAEYVRWRRDGTALLTALKQLREGLTLDEQDAKRVLLHLQQIDHASVRRNGHPSDKITGAIDAQYLLSMNIDWASVHESAFETHVSEFDERFAAVGISAPQTNTLVVELTRPCAYFLDLTAFPTFSPIHETIELLRSGSSDSPITEEGLVVYDAQWTKPDYDRCGYPGLITNGPYCLSEWRFKRHARLKVNPYFHDADSIACRSVEMVVYEDLNAAIMAYEAGDLDFLPAMDVPYDHEIARLARNGDRPDFHLCVLLATYFFNFNCISEKVNGKPNPFLDARVRKAFALATDKAALVEQVLKRGDRVAHSFVPPSAIPGYEPPQGLKYNPEEARRLLATAGYSGGAGLPPIELLHTPRDQWVCQAMARIWQSELGVTVNLAGKETKTFGEDKANHRFMIARGNWYADYNDPTTFLDCLSTGNGNNDSGYSSLAYDTLLVQASQTHDPSERMKLLQEAEAIIVQNDLPILPILHYTSPIAIKENIEGLSPNPRMLFPFKHVRVVR